MDKMPESDVERLLAERACERLLHRYAYCQDNGLPDEFAELYADDAIWVRSAGPLLEGRAAIREAARAMFHRPGGPERLVHMLSNILVTVDGDTAASTCCSLAYKGVAAAGREGAPLTDMVGILIYRNAFRRVPGEGWRIARHEASFLFGP